MAGKHGSDGKARELTVPTILKYRPHATKRREISDSKGQGLRLVIQPKTGRMSWIVRLRRPDGTSAKLTLGPVDFSDKDTADETVAGGSLTLWQARQRAAEIDRRRAGRHDVVLEEKASRERKRTAVADAEANSFATAVREFFINYETGKWHTRPRRWRSDAALLGLKYKPGSDPADPTTKPEIIKGGLCETWAKKSVTEIDSYAVHTVIDQARKIKNSRARKLHSALSVLFTWLQRDKTRRLTINPVAGVWKPGPPVARNRALKPDEIKVLWRACDDIGGAFGALYKILLLTGCRLKEVSDMARAELGDKGVWEIPSSRTKNHLPFLVPLPQAVIDIINAVPPPIKSKHGIGHNNPPESIEPPPSDLVFTTNGRTAVSGFSKAKKALDAKMTEIAGQPIPPWRVHDLRRTFSTIMNESPEDRGLGVPPHIVEACINHISGGAKSGTAGVYNQARYLSEKRAALARWATHVDGLVQGRAPKVLPMAKRKNRPRSPIA
jgi:integrase